MVGNVQCFEIVPEGTRYESFMGNFKTHQNYSSKSACLYFLGDYCNHLRCLWK